MVPEERLATASPTQSGQSAMARMADLGVNQLPVVSEGRVVGAVTREALLGVVRAHLLLGQETGSPSGSPR